MDQRTIEFTCYFSRLPPVDAIDRLFATVISELSPAPTSIHFLDDRFKGQKKKYSSGIIQELFSQGSHKEILSVIASSKVRGEDNRIPRSSCILSRISYGHPDIYSFSMRADEKSGVSAAEMIMKWCELVQPLESFSGFGSSRAKMNLDFDYGIMHLMHVDVPSAAYAIAAGNIEAFRENQLAFLGVAEGRSLRSVFPVNFMGGALHKRIALDFESKSMAMPGRVVCVGKDIALWILDIASEQMQSFEHLKKERLVFDKEWLDLESYVPANFTFSIPYDTVRSVRH